MTIDSVAAGTVLTTGTVENDENQKSNNQISRTSVDRSWENESNCRLHSQRVLFHSASEMTYIVSKWPILCRNDLYCVGRGVLTVLFQGRFQKNHKIEINSVTLFQFVWNNSKKFHMGKNIAINSIVCFRRWKVCDWNIKLIDWDLTALSVQICYSVLQQICCS